MFVHGPSRICTHASLMPIETFAFVFTGGKTKGCEKPAGLGDPVTVPVAVAPDIFGALAKRIPIAAKTPAIISANKALLPISRCRIHTDKLLNADAVPGWGEAVESA
jgi:hypothetical protein